MLVRVGGRVRDGVIELPRASRREVPRRRPPASRDIEPGASTGGSPRGSWKSVERWTGAAAASRTAALWPRHPPAKGSGLRVEGGGWRSEFDEDLHLFPVGIEERFEAVFDDVFEGNTAVDEGFRVESAGFEHVDDGAELLA